jgi:hypothetical protein
MLTVKHVANGTERIYPAPFGAEYVGPHANWGIGGPHLSIPLVQDAPGFGVQCKVLHGGTAYVMNDGGSTVGVYHLGNPPEGDIELLRGQSFGEASAA